MLDRTIKTQTASFLVNGMRASITLELRRAQLRESGFTIDFEPIPADATELSICGSFDSGAGQIVDSLRDATDDPQVTRLCELWDRWHLNGMKAGSRAQLECLAQHSCRDYNESRAYLGHYGLLRVPTPPGSGIGLEYEYGTKWLFEPVLAEVLEELATILTDLHGRKIGDAPDVSDAPDLDGNVLDSRDVIKRLEIYRAAVEAAGIDPEAYDSEGETAEPELTELVEELQALEALEQEADGCGDWQYGATLIRDSYFEEYAQDLARDLYGDKIESAHWPFDYIDWEAAANALKVDYCEVTYRGDTYWVRS